MKICMKKFEAHLVVTLSLNFYNISQGFNDIIDCLWIFLFPGQVFSRLWKQLIYLKLPSSLSLSLQHWRWIVQLWLIADFATLKSVFSECFLLHSRYARLIYLCSDWRQTSPHVQLNHRYCQRYNSKQATREEFALYVDIQALTQWCCCFLVSITHRYTSETR